nr:MAG TPA: hypothetical protein [Caudoviricetes sp.]
MLSLPTPSAATNLSCNSILFSIIPILLLELYLFYYYYSI